MTILLLGLVIFLGVHSTRIVADGWRSAQIARIGPGPWKLGYTVLSLIGFYLLLWGYGAARQAPVVLWTPPVAMRHLAGLLTLIAFVLLAATYVPRNGIKARLHHPMVLSVKLWALAHLLANGTLADVLLFGSFLAWAVLSFRAARRRDRAAGALYPAGTAAGTLATVAVGSAAWALFAFRLHGWLIGVQPFHQG
ncbi:NnrU family protein [Noviherbaspirillum soli]|uniref:NnrU family protein n=1 Tax=Noviherbaspirillum soli TaxID=1064518 RepID=UPI00188D050F|nr:NnrU family protein [Noviherbaspirillum soli]